MTENGIKNPSASLEAYGINGVATGWWNLSQAQLVEHSLRLNEGLLSDKGALSVSTGKFTGRSPKDKFIVKDSITENHVNWSDSNNNAFEPAAFDALYNKIVKYFAGKEVYIKDASACADPAYRLNLRLVTDKPWSALFAGNMFLRPTAEELKTHTADWLILQAPEFNAIPAEDGTRQGNFAIINFTKKIIIIGGTAYTGEIKKGIFSVLNFILPVDKGVFPMHSSSNIGKGGDTAVFFGLSGTGKTTLSADPDRKLIGDDEHGWSDKGVFNFEGGCYAKCIDLTEEKEPEIFSAIKFGALLENIKFYPGTRTVDFADTSITENTRVSYPIEHIPNSVHPSVGGIPKNLFFLACDAYGVLPPISKLTTAQAMFYFLSGYTAKVAGTEAGVTEPKSTFSACFGAPFLPLHPTEYAKFLGERMTTHKANVWLINTGWSGGAYGVGKRMKLSYTRAMITAALNGALEHIPTDTHNVFGIAIPKEVPGVPSDILNPRNTWADKAAYDKQANLLAKEFADNFKKFENKAAAEVLAAMPKVLELV